MNYVVSLVEGIFGSGKKMHCENRSCTIKLVMFPLDTGDRSKSSIIVLLLVGLVICGSSDGCAGQFLIHKTTCSGGMCEWLFWWCLRC